ncbi:MAG TPA: hypothetical protein VGM05_30645 [Planctomycetaceae bacterium]
MSRILLGLYLLVGTAALAPVPIAADEIRAARIESLRKTAAKAVDNEVATKAYKALFSFANDEELSALRNDDDLGIALYARWQARNSKDLQLRAASHPERLTGFLEGRTGIKCPAT